MKKEKSFSYEKFRSSYSLNCPDNFNFALDIISNKYGKSEKTVFIALNKNGNDFEKIKQYLKNIPEKLFLQKIFPELFLVR